MNINSSYKPMVYLDNSMFTPDRLLQVPNMCSFDLDRARDVGGVCINAILDGFDQVGVDLSDCSITTRTYDLSVGDSTHPLDWHCDGHLVGDDVGFNREEVIQYIGHFGPNQIPFEVISDVVESRGIEFQGHTSYEDLANLVNSGQYNITQHPTGCMAKFNTSDIHRVLPSTSVGVRTLVIVSNVHKFFPQLVRNTIAENVSLS